MNFTPQSVVPEKNWLGRCSRNGDPRASDPRPHHRQSENKMGENHGQKTNEKVSTTDWRGCVWWSASTSTTTTNGSSSLCGSNITSTKYYLDVCTNRSSRWSNNWYQKSEHQSFQPTGITVWAKSVSSKSAGPYQEGMFILLLLWPVSFNLALSAGAYLSRAAAATTVLMTVVVNVVTIPTYMPTPTRPRCRPLRRNRLLSVLLYGARVAFYFPKTFLNVLSKKS